MKTVSRLLAEGWVMIPKFEHRYFWVYSKYIALSLLFNILD